MKRMIVTGSVPYRSFKDKLRLIKQLEREFHNRVKIRDYDGLLTYTHEVVASPDESMLNTY